MYLCETSLCHLPACVVQASLPLLHALTTWVRQNIVKQTFLCVLVYALLAHAVLLGAYLIVCARLVIFSNLCIILLHAIPWSMICANANHLFQYIYIFVFTSMLLVDIVVLFPA